MSKLIPQRDFPGGPVVKTSRPVSAVREGSVPGQEAKIDPTWFMKWPKKTTNKL